MSESNSADSVYLKHVAAIKDKEGRKPRARLSIL